MTVHKFEDIIAWQKAQDLAVNIYSDFGKLNDYSFRNQICAASVSISNNIAEGFDRSSNADFCRFLYMAAGSASEVRSMLYLAELLSFIDSVRKTLLIERTNEVSRLIYGFIKSLTNN